MRFGGSNEGEAVGCDREAKDGGWRDRVGGCDEAFVAADRGDAEFGLENPVNRPVCFSLVACEEENGGGEVEVKPNMVVCYGCWWVVLCSTDLEYLERYSYTSFI